MISHFDQVVRAVGCIVFVFVVSVKGGTWRSRARSIGVNCMSDCRKIYVISNHIAERKAPNRRQSWKRYLGRKVFSTKAHQPVGFQLIDDSCTTGVQYL